MTRNFHVFHGRIPDNYVMAKPQQEILLTPQETLQVIDDLAARLHKNITHPHKRVIVGIRTGGAAVTKLLVERLNALLGLEMPTGYLDITFYRDDLDTIGPNPVLEATELGFNIDDKRIILVDDVLYTGRTIRAAFNALFDYGRPEMVDLVVLVDRGNRQLPIQPNYAGVTVESTPKESIKLLNNEQEDELTLVRQSYGQGG